MTEQEIVREFSTDFLNVFRFSNTKDAKFRRMVLKSAKFPTYAYCEYVSPLKNKWLVLFEARNKKAVGDNCLITFIATYNSAHGVYAIMHTATNGRNHLVFFPPHFFSRYAERTGKVISGIDLIRAYFTDNSSFCYSLDDEAAIYGSTKEGVAMGFITAEDNIMFKTFITYDMTKGQQIEEFAKNEKIRLEIHGR